MIIRVHKAYVASSVFHSAQVSALVRLEPHLYKERRIHAQEARPNDTRLDVAVLCANIPRSADRREFTKISQAVGMGFLIMGVIGYVVKLSSSPSQEHMQESILTRSQYIYPSTTSSWEALEDSCGDFWVVAK
jgi:hypothetical protein